MHGNGISHALYLQTKASHYFMHWFDATNFCERNKNQTLQYITDTLHDLTVSTVATLSN